MRSIKSNWKIFGVIGVAAVVVLPILGYMLKFGSIQLSNNFDDWVSFSIFWSPFIGGGLTILLAYLSWQSFELMKLKEKPLLVVEKRAKKEGGEEFQFIRNIGSGPALDIKLFIQVSSEMIDFDRFLSRAGITSVLEEVYKRSEFHYMVCFLNLSPNEPFFIDWQSSIQKFSIVYSDIYGRKKTLTYEEDIPSTLEGDKIGINNRGFKGMKMIFLRDKSPKWKYNQVFSLAEIGKKVYNFEV